MEQLDGTPVITCADAADWHSWLAANHATAPAVWILIAKKNSAQRSPTITETLDGALCYGWIDSVRRTHSPDYYLQRYSPRRPKSPWSAINIAKAEALIATGRMHASGLAAIEKAKADGRWTA
ncbi:YdeI family protein [Nocardia sp. NPDC127579]|uniref:YdeI/OmpD-associated family protein n=1 Tax=Nocardia sp. NPDC127579 TaxID=3345402 RepID=UPI00363B5E48